MFWFVSQDKPLPVYNTNNESGIIDEVAALLTNAKTRATEAEISRIAATLTKSKTTVSSAEREKISVILESY